MSIKPLLDFASPVLTPIGNFLNSGSNYNPNESAASNFTQSFSTPSNLFDDTFMSDNMDLTYGGGEVPEFTGLGPIEIKGGPENVIQGQNNGMTSAQKEALTSMGSYNAFNGNTQINPAGTSSPDGMMTMPTNYLYPGEAIGIDGVPYRPSAGTSTASSGGGGGGGGGNSAASSTPVANVLGTRRFNQRTPSGSVYAPDMSAYNDSSLFNYTGQGGVPEYTYGQGLPTDGAGYNIWGSPANVANPYYEGQFAKSVGPADAAINMPAIEMPAGVPAIGGGSGTTTVNPLDQGKYMGNPNHYNSGQDLSYKQTIDSMGIFGPNNPPPSTTFPSPGGATTPANMGLTERQIAQMSPQQQAYITQTLKDQDRMQRGQISNAASNIFNPNEQINAAGVSSPDGMMTMPTQPTAMQNYMNDSQSASGVTDRTAEIMAYAKANNNMVDGVTIFDEGDPRQIFQDSILNPTNDIERENVMGGLDGTPYPFSGMPPERDTFKADEIDISTPFVPEGQEGVDYWQSTTGEFFNMEDDMGTQPLGPVDPFAGMPPERDFFKSDEAGIDKPANLSSYEADGNIESTSNNMAALNDSFAAIDAKYAGSTTDASAGAELGEIINTIINANGGSGSTNARGSKGDTVPADIPAFLDQNISRMADNYIPSPAETDYPPAYPSYAIEDEGTSTGESLFQGVPEVPIDSQYEYSGAYENAAGSNAAIDAIVRQQQAQQAQAARKQAADQAADQADRARAQAQAQAQADRQQAAAAADRARAQAQAQAQARARAAAAADRKDAARRPVYTPKPAAKPKPKSKTPDYTKTYTRRYGL